MTFECHKKRASKQQENELSLERDSSLKVSLIHVGKLSRQSKREIDKVNDVGDLPFSIYIGAEIVQVE